ncbi:MAG TPA: hypothetical protein VHA13_03950, partial [Gammaproteobacteria bacterium]|nr:hypothetical protein [Gammaproteobacteria bacterium]
MSLSSESIKRAAIHLQDILSLAIKHTHDHQALIVFDKQSQLATILTQAYQLILPQATFINFDLTTPDFIKAQFNKLKPHDLVVLIQSDSFRLDAFRIRVELFKKSLKVIEHPHLARMQDIQAEYYIDALAYDPHYYHHVGNQLKQLIDSTSRAIVNSGELLFFNSTLESAKLNIGDYSHMPNIGGQFPIGEVFTEAKDLEAVSGKVRIFAFGDTDFSVKKVETPITLIVDKGRVVGTDNSVPAFD